MKLPYQAVSVATMLRDYIEVEYINDEHKRLCDCADSVYNAGIPREMWNDNPDYDYKGLYDRYGKEFWAEVFKDMDAIDTQLDSYNADDLEDDYNYIKQQLTEEK